MWSDVISHHDAKWDPSKAEQEMFFLSLIEATNTDQSNTNAGALRT